MDDCEYTDISCDFNAIPLSVIVAASHLRLEDGPENQLRTAQRVVLVCAE